MTFRIRHLSLADYAPVISVIDQWWGGRPMAGMLPRLFFEHFTDTSFAAERDGRLAGFQPCGHLRGGVHRQLRIGKSALEHLADGAFHAASGLHSRHSCDSNHGGHLVDSGDGEVDPDDGRCRRRRATDNGDGQRRCRACEGTSVRSHCFTLPKRHRLNLPGLSSHSPRPFNADCK